MRDTTKRFLSALAGVIVFVLLVPYAAVGGCALVKPGSRGGGCVLQSQSSLVVTYPGSWPSWLLWLIAVGAGAIVYLGLWSWVSPKRLTPDAAPVNDTNPA
jgi:hypothetical protein